MVRPIQPVAGGGGPHLFRDLAPGRVVRLQLVEPGINGGIVSLNGRLYRAAGVLPARPGEHFWALVEKVRPDQITVRHLAPVEPGRGGVSAGDLVRVLGLPPGGEAEQVVRELLRLGLPLERESVLRVLDLGRGLGLSERPGFWPALAWLQTQELPPGAGALGKVLAYLLGRPEAEPEGQELLNRSRPRAEYEAVQALTLNGGKRLQGDLYILGSPGWEAPSAGVRLLLRLWTPARGEFWVGLDFEGDVLRGRVVTPDKNAAALFRDAVGLLEERLRELGYRVRPFAVETGRLYSVADMLAGSRVAAYVPLDIRV